MFVRHRFTSLALLTCLSTAAAAPGAEAPAEGGALKVKRGPFRVTFDADGTFVPAQATELAFQPRAYEGELRIQEVVPHGAAVRQGDVVLKIDDEKAREALRAAEWAVILSERAVADGKARQADFDADSERDLARAEKDLALAEKSLKGYVEVSRALEREEYESSERSYKHNIADQEDEIAQLGKMYKEDQLTEETEEIVLKRAKRGLEELKKRLVLLQRRNAYGEEFTEPVQRETLENATKDRRRAFRDLRRSRETARVTFRIEMEKLERDHQLAEQRLERLRSDVEHLTLRAPHDGIVLHGTFEDRIAVAPLKKSGLALPNAPLVTVARSGPLKLRFPVKEKDRYRLEAGMAATIVPEALAERPFTGSLEPLGTFPLPDNTWSGHVIFGNADPRLLPLLKAKVSVTLHEGMDSVVVPLGAVFRKGDRSICYVRKESPFGIAARTVVTGPDDGKSVVIREGLNDGDEVLLQEPAQ